MIKIKRLKLISRNLYLIYNHSQQFLSLVFAVLSVGQTINKPVGIVIYNCIIAQQMGIKSIKSITDNYYPDPLFEYQNMVHVNKKQPILNYYKFIKKIGAGTYGEVFKAQNIHTGHLRAIKKINTLKYARARALVMCQITLLKNMDHPSILKIYEIYEQAQFIFIVTQLCEGRELFDVIVDRHHFEEDQACFIFYDLLTTVRCMHGIHIMHRDLKPQNIMYEEHKKILKIIDFGSGVRFQNSNLKNRKRVGTPYYIAPQVLARCYNQKCDIWSMGVILYILLCGQPPFPGKNDQEVMENISKSKGVRFRKETWKKVSGKAKLLIQKMLERDVQKRLTAAQVMQDDWFNDHLFKRKLDKNQQRTVAYHLRNMQRYKDLDANAIQEGMLIFIINFVKDKHDEQQLSRSFKELDLNKDGVISLQELQLGLAKYLNVQPKQSLIVAKQIFEKVDLNKSGFIDFSEFVMCASNIQITVNEENLDVAFDYIDTDKSGKLSVAEIREKLGDNISEQMYSNLLRQFDKNNDGQISRDQFKTMMTVLVRKTKK